MSPACDDLGTAPGLVRPPRRVVSLVPSLTEAVAATAPDLLVGATDYCSHPPGLDVRRVGGSKWPDLDRVRALRPELVLANAEENRLADIDALRADGIPVWVTGPTDLPGALDSLAAMLSACGLAEPDWLSAARDAWSGPVPDQTSLAVIPIWRRPWMVVGQGTFTGDVLRRLGVGNVYGSCGERYPKTPLGRLLSSDADLVVLPDEPYAFTADDGPECFGGRDVALVSGRHLTWYGPSLVAARDLLAAQLAAATRYS